MARQVPGTRKDLTPVVITNPVGIDRVITRLQQSFANNLSWLSKSYGKIQRMHRVQDGADYFFPGIWLGRTTEAEDLLADDNQNAYTFSFPVGSAIPIDGYNEFTQNYYNRDLVVIFWFNQRKVLPTLDHPIHEDLMIEIEEVIRNTTFDGNDSVDILTMTDVPEEIFTEYSVDLTNQQNLMYPFGGIRITLQCYYSSDQVCIPQLEAPTGLVLSNVTENAIQLDWVSNSSSLETGFGIERGLTSTSLSQIDTTATNVTTYTSTGLNPGTEYFYRVRALGVDPSNSEYSNIQSATTDLAFDPDAQSWISRMTNPTLDQQNAINTFIIAEKSAGNFALYDEFFLLVLGAVNSLVGVKSKTASANGSPVFSSLGITLNGLDQDVDTGYVPSVDGVNLTDNNALIGGFVNVHNGSTSQMIGGSDAGVNNGLHLFSTSLPDQIGYRLNSDLRTFSNPGGINNNGLYLAAKDSTTSAIFSIDGITVDTSAITGVSPNAFSVSIGSDNSSGSSVLYFDGILSTFIVGAGIGFNHASHNTNVRNLLTTLGAI